MAFTDLRDVWCADIVDTDERIQADGKWTTVFPEDVGVVQDLIFDPLITAPSASSVLPSVSVRRGSVVYPNGNPGIDVKMDGVWTGFDTPSVQSLGMWPPSNIGWAPSDPVIWPLQVFRRPTETTASGNTQHDHFLRRINGYTLSVGSSPIFGDRGGNPIMWVDVLPESVVFAHYSGGAQIGVVTVGILGVTWLPAGSVHRWDFFKGMPVSAHISIAGETGSFPLGGTDDIIVQGNTNSGDSFSLQRSRVVVGDFEAEKEAVLWWKASTISGGTLAAALNNEDNTTLTLSWEYRPIGEAGPNMLGGS